MHASPRVIHNRLRLRSRRRQHVAEYMLALLCGLLQGLHLQTGGLAPKERRNIVCMYGKGSNAYHRAAVHVDLAEEMEEAYFHQGCQVLVQICGMQQQVLHQSQQQLS